MNLNGIGLSLTIATLFDTALAVQCTPKLCPLYSVRLQEDLVREFILYPLRSYYT